jgi:hypothetical protein
MMKKTPLSLSSLSPEALREAVTLLEEKKKLALEQEALSAKVSKVDARLEELSFGGAAAKAKVTKVTKPVKAVKPKKAKKVKKEKATPAAEDSVSSEAPAPVVKTPKAAKKPAAPKKTAGEKKPGMKALILAKLGEVKEGLTSADLANAIDRDVHAVRVWFSTTGKALVASGKISKDAEGRYALVASEPAA